MPVDFRIGDVIQLRKPHPCGGADWTVVRIGADIGLRCNTCSHRILLSRREAEHGMRGFVSRTEARDPFAADDPLEASSGADPDVAGPFAASSPDEAVHGH
jgi:hypothetical protein